MTVVLNWDIVLSAAVGTAIGIAVVLVFVKVIGPAILVLGIVLFDFFGDVIDALADSRKHADRR